MTAPTLAPRRRGAEAEFSIGFLTALVSEELIPCEAVLASRGWNPEHLPELRAAGIGRWAKMIEGRRILAHSMAIGRMGQAASAVETMIFLERCQRPTIVFLTGIAGSLWDNKVFKADVVVSRNTRWRTQNKIFGEDGCDRYRPFDNILAQPGTTADLSRVIQRHLVEEFPHRERGPDDIDAWNAHYGEIYTWDYVINSSRTTAKINDAFPEALCVEMEAGGFLAAMERLRAVGGRRPMLGHVVRGISDYAARKDKDKSVRTAASRNAALVAVSLAEMMCGPEALGYLARSSL